MSSILTGYILGSVIGATVCTYFDTHSDEYESLLKQDRYANSVMLKKHHFIKDRFIYYFTDIATYPVRHTLVYFAERRYRKWEKFIKRDD
jgi:hypothetical protein